MTLLIIGIVVFLGLHLLPTVSDMRQTLAVRLGENDVAFAAMTKWADCGPFFCTAKRPIFLP